MDPFSAPMDILPHRTVKPASCAVCVAVALSIAMALVPPFTSVSGTEYAFVLSGPAWSRAVGADLGLTAHLHWPLLLAQLAAVWAVALGTQWAFARAQDEAA